MRRRGRGLIVTVLAVLVSPTAAFAHGGTDRAGYSNYRADITSIVPALDGLEAQLLDVNGGIRLTYTGSDPLYVLGYTGEPYLRAGPDGVFANLNSPATYVNDRTDANVPVPDHASSDATPDWYRLSTGHSVTWHDHRLHWMGSIPPPDVQAAPGETHLVFPSWTLPLLIGTAPVTITGELWWIPPPHKSAWLLGALSVFVATVVLMQLASAWAATAIGVTALGTAAVWVVALGRFVVARGLLAHRLAVLALPLAITVLAVGAVVRIVRGATRPPLVGGVAGVGLIAAGAAWYKMLSYSHADSEVAEAVNRLCVAGALGLGATLVASYVVARFGGAPTLALEPASVAGSDAAA